MENVTISYTVISEHVARFKELYLAANKVPIDEETGEPEMTDFEFIKLSIKRLIKTELERGRRSLLKQANPPDIPSDIVK